MFFVSYTMEGNYIQLQQKMQNMKININEINRIVEKKSEMIASLKEQQKEINKKITTEEHGLNDNIKKKKDLRKNYLKRQIKVNKQLRRSSVIYIKYDK